MPPLRQIAALAVLLGGMPTCPGPGATAAPVETVAEPAEPGRTEVFAEAIDEAAEEGRLADRLPVGLLEARWRARGSSLAAVRLYQRVDWQPRPGLAAHLLTERDPGEARWNDFSSGYVDWRGPWGAATVGDLRPAFGQGLVFGRSGSRGGSSPAPRGDRLEGGYRSTAESGAARGLLLALRRDGFTTAVLLSRLIWDGRVDESGTLTSVLDAGLHVTPSEQAGRDRLRGSAAGAALRWQRPGRAAGLQVLTVELTRKLDLRRAGKVMEAFHGRGQRLVSADLLWRGGAALAYGEVAVDAAQTVAALGGLRVGERRLRAAAQAYHYPPQWYSFLGGAASRAGMSNESGVQIEVAGRGWRLWASENRRLQSAYTHPLPAPTDTWGAQIERGLGRGWRAAAAFEARSGAEYSQGDEKRQASRRVRLELERDTGGQRWRWRCEGRALGSASADLESLDLESINPGSLDEDAPRETGAVASLAWRWRGRRGELALHGSGFHTASYAARLYEYELDLPGAVSILPLYGTGWRGYAVARFCWRDWSVGLRYRRLHARGRPSRAEGGVQLDLAVGG